MTTKQKRAAEILAENPRLKDKEVAEMLDITPQSMCRWKKSEEWNKYYEECLKKVWHRYGQEAQKLMWNKAEDGDFRAIEYICNSAGLKPSDKLDVNADGLIIKVSIDGD